MQTENRFFEDISRLVNSAAGTIAGVGREAEAATRERVKEWVSGLDFVGRDEFDAVKAMAIAARDEADALKARLDALEGKAANPAVAKPAAKPSAKVAAEPAVAKPAAKKAAPKKAPKA
jgi:BMFP domain-containing protein YqiC